jgi:hypothetical protein
MKSKITFALAALAACIAPSLAAGQSVQRVVLSPSGLKKVTGAIKGKAYSDYLVQVGAGQSASVVLSSKSSSVYFNLLPPGSKGEGLYNGSTNGNRMAPRILPMAGRYIIRVYQMGAAASEGKTNQFSFTVSVKGIALKPLSSASDAKLKGTPFHARSEVSASFFYDKERSRAEAYVIRYGNGSATVEFRAGTMVRRVLFLRGVPKASDSQEAFTYSKAGDNTTIRFGDDPTEQFIVPDALIFGG